MARTIEIEDNVTVGILAEKLTIPVTQLIGELMRNGIIATVNEQVDFDTAQIVVGELGLNDVELVKKEVSHRPSISEKKKVHTDINLPTRPPVVAVMGHVDHGKTSLLDAIRSSEVVKQEAGGITQHISAYQVRHQDRLITFLDTPGHEAFAAIRAHGAELTDLVIIVVAADDGVKPQTIEAIRFAHQAGSKIIVAANKIDKAGADINRLKQQLAEHSVMAEGWGGDVVVVEVSAKTKQGIDQLLDMVLLTADLEDLRAPVDVPAEGLVIEAHMERGHGPVVYGLVTEGTLHTGDAVIAGTTYGKIRNLASPDGQEQHQATPSTPVKITGFKELPEFADTFFVVKNEKEAKQRAGQLRIEQKETTTQNGLNSGELISIINRSNQVQELPVLVKADVQGSLTTVIDSLKTLETSEVFIKVVSSSVGNINESDIHLAHTAHAMIMGFNVEAPANIKRIASRDKVPIHLYRVIYELIDDAKVALGKLLAPEIVETELGTLIIKGVFKTTKTEVICGGEVEKGKLTAPALVRIVRGKDEVIAEAELTNLKRGPQDAKEVVEGELCGMNLKTRSKVEVKEGDHIIVFKREMVERKL